MSTKPLETPSASARFDAEKQVIWVTYRGLLDAMATASVYGWLAEFFDSDDVEQVRGEVFDFREVTMFGADNLMEARRKSRGFNLKQDTSLLPVAMITANFYQEEILRGPMQNVPENMRKTIVRSEADALDFIDNWHRQRENEEA